MNSASGKFVYIDLKGGGGPYKGFWRENTIDSEHLSYLVKFVERLGLKQIPSIGLGQPREGNCLNGLI
jgi:hypothetical protein